MSVPSPGSDELIGRTFTIAAPHVGHTVRVVRRDIDKHQAYWLECECGEELLIGELWVKRAVASGSMSHEAFGLTRVLRLLDP